MRTSADLRDWLRRNDGKGYGSYRDLEGAWAFEAFVLVVDHVQSDPFASPSHLTLEIALEDLGIDRATFHGRTRKRACEDFLLRLCHRASSGLFHRRGGRGRGGEVQFQSFGQEVLERNGLLLDSHGLILRLLIGLPGHGRRVAGREASALLCEELPRFVGSVLLEPALDEKAMAIHGDCVEDQVALRAQLEAKGLVSFVADGSLLPRRSGIDDRPMGGPELVPFVTPPELAVELQAPHGGSIRGMGLPVGITLLVGGGYHGKSTLLRAIERGVWDHCPGDGREGVVTVVDGARIRAEDGRSVSSLDISNYIAHLPNRIDTTCFSTENASGSTSQAAGIVEALEAGSSLLMVDEDTSATNFMIRDPWMRRLVSDAQEPITPFVDSLRSLHRDHGVSTVLVVGGSGDYFAVADRVLQLDGYRVRDVTKAAAVIARDMASLRGSDRERTFRPLRERWIDLTCIDARKGRKALYVKERGGTRLCLGTKEIDLSSVEQVVAPDQILAIGHALAKTRQHARNEMTMPELLKWIDAEFHTEGLDTLNPWPGRHPGTYMSRPRPLEIAGALNRLRGLRIARPR